MKRLCWYALMIPCLHVGAAPAADTPQVQPGGEWRSVSGGPGPHIVAQVLLPALGGNNDTADREVRFGHAVAVDRGWLQVGVPDRVNDDNSQAGGVFYFRQASGASWNPFQAWLVQTQGSPSGSRCGRSGGILGRPGGTPPGPLPRTEFAVMGCPEAQSLRGVTWFHTRFAGSGQFGTPFTPSGEASGDRCGHAVAIAGSGLPDETFVATGCIGRGPAQAMSRRGEVDLYRHTVIDALGNVGWRLDATVVFDSPSQPTNLSFWDFGHSLSMDRRDDGLLRLAVGMPGIDGNSGQVLVFERLGAGQVVEVARLGRPGGIRAGARFGFSVALDGNHLAVGAPGDGSALDSDGRVHTFERNVLSGAWQPAVTIDPLSGILNNQDGSRFGHAVAMAGNRLWVGQPYWRNAEGNPRGRVRHYLRTGASPQPVAYDLAQTFFDADPLAPNDGEFGWSVAIDRDDAGTVVIGYPRAGRVLPTPQRWGRAWVLVPDRILANDFGCAAGAC